MLLHFALVAAFTLQQAEFAKYHREITGRDPAPGSVTFAVDPKVSVTGRDAYVIRSVRGESSAPAVSIIGSNERATWYGLYDLLERRGGCHWFWDVDVVPKRAALDLNGLDVKEEARFEYRGLRYFAHRGLTRFQAEQWGPDDWKREIDWCLKRRLNVFMLRIGQDDLFQRAFPDVCTYPDASQPLPGAGKGYDNRTLFWSLEYRGRLRQRIQKYAFDRGLMVSEDFGTMTHWYSRTPEDFLAKRNPSFLPQATKGYGERNGLVWDIRDKTWVDAYWKLTTTACTVYGQGADQQLLHTIGLGERRCFTNRQDNLNLKLYALRQFLDRAHRDYPRAKNLLAGWDFYFTWHPDEVRALVKTLDPQRDIIWDYEGDATRDYRPEMKDVGGNNFTKWGVVGAFPYTFSIFLAFENALDARANYPLIEARQKVVQEDPFCVGYVFWPESSHTDTLCLRFFTANAWSREPVGIAEVLPEFCASRYGVQAEAMRKLWSRALPMTWLHDWGSNYGYLFTRAMLGSVQYNRGSGESVEQWLETMCPAPEVFDGLAEINWTDEAIRRDTVDLARMTLDRVLVARTRAFSRDFEAWRAGRRGGSDLALRAREMVRLADLMADVLELHTDFSLWESYERLNAVEKVTNPDFPKVLFDNASNGYCQSHQYELARHWYLPRARAFAAKAEDLLARGDRTSALSLESGEILRQKLMTRPINALRPLMPRTPENYRCVMRTLARILHDNLL